MDLQYHHVFVLHIASEGGEKGRRKEKPSAIVRINKPQNTRQRANNGRRSLMTSPLRNDQCGGNRQVPHSQGLPLYPALAKKLIQLLSLGPLQFPSA